MAGRPDGGHQPHFTATSTRSDAANNLLAAMIDNHIYQGITLGIDSRRIVWRRCMDMNDRQLRFLTDGREAGSTGSPRGRLRQHERPKSWRYSASRRDSKT
jgi:formyltetrahydrofolate synthetase